MLSRGYTGSENLRICLQAANWAESQKFAIAYRVGRSRVEIYRAVQLMDMWLRNGAVCFTCAFNSFATQHSQDNPAGDNESER